MHAKTWSFQVAFCAIIILLNQKQKKAFVSQTSEDKTDFLHKTFHLENLRKRHKIACGGNNQYY